jgi:hypothetical protein
VVVGASVVVDVVELVVVVVVGASVVVDVVVDVVVVVVVLSKQLTQSELVVHGTLQSTAATPLGNDGL